LIKRDDDYIEYDIKAKIKISSVVDISP